MFDHNKTLKKPRRCFIEKSLVLRLNYEFLFIQKNSIFSQKNWKGLSQKPSLLYDTAFYNTHRELKWLHSDQVSQETPKPQKFIKKVMMCVWWKESCLTKYWKASRRLIATYTVSCLDHESTKNRGTRLDSVTTYSPDLAPFDYHLFRSMEHSLSNMKFTNIQHVRK